MTVFDTFKNITGYDIELYLNDFSSFVLSDYQQIVGYYQGLNNIESSTILKINSLTSSMLQINDLFNIYLDRLSSGTAEVWELLDYFESTKVTLFTIINSSRWYRSTKNVLRSNSVNNDFILKQGQSLEQLALELGHTDAINEWSDIAINNDIREEDYSFEGGNKLKVSFINDLNYTITSVIDSISGEKLYGKDIDRVLTFANNDIVTLGYRDTIIQQTQILLGLKKGSVPEFPLDGIDKSIVGSNINAIQYPVLLRQQSSVFEKDDRYKSISIDTFEQKSESLVINFQITTKLDEVLNEQLVLQ